LADDGAHLGDLYDWDGNWAGNFTRVWGDFGDFQLGFFNFEQRFRYPHFHVMAHRGLPRYTGRYFENWVELKTVCTVKINPDCGLYTKENLRYESLGESWHNDLLEGDLDLLLAHLNSEFLGDIRDGFLGEYLSGSKPSLNKEWLRDVKGTCSEAEDKAKRKDRRWWREFKEMGH
jgi:hypothetical protein